MKGFTMRANRLEHWVAHRLAPHQDRLLQISIDLLRVSLGLVFILFGALKFIPGLSPAEGLATQTMERLTFGLMPEGIGLIVVATMEPLIGLSLVTGWYLRLGLALLAVTMLGILSPLVLFTDDLFSGPNRAPTLAAVYIIKDIVLLAAALVVSVRALRKHPIAPGSHPPVDLDRRDGQPRGDERGGTRRRLAAAAMLLMVAGGMDLVLVDQKPGSSVVTSIAGEISTPPTGFTVR